MLFVSAAYTADLYAKRIIPRSFKAPVVYNGELVPSDIVMEHGCKQLFSYQLLGIDVFFKRQKFSVAGEKSFGKAELTELVCVSVLSR